MASKTRRQRSTNRHIKKLMERKKLEKRIDATKKLISELPPCGDGKDGDGKDGEVDNDFRSPAGIIKANHLKTLYEQEETYDLYLEADRVSTVVYEHGYLYYRQNEMETCPICLEEISTGECGLMQWFSCCGNGFCAACVKSFDKEVKCCPLCRTGFGMLGRDEVERRKEVLAENGRPWAQTEMGTRHLTGEHGFPIDVAEAFRWFGLAAERRFPGALYGLSGIYKTGIEGVLEASEEKAMELMKDAADSGYSKAQWALALRYTKPGGEGGCGDGVYAPTPKASFYATLAYSQGEEMVSNLLGRLHLDGDGVTQSHYRAKHYIGRAAGRGDGTSFFNFARTLYELGQRQYGGVMDVPGHSCIPRVLFWARKAHAAGNEYGEVAAELIDRLERDAMSRCANCRRRRVAGNEKFKTCMRCKAVWYCGRDCQVKHWKDGHQVDCVKREMVQEVVLDAQQWINEDRGRTAVCSS